MPLLDHSQTWHFVSTMAVAVTMNERRNILSPAELAKAAERLRLGSQPASQKYHMSMRDRRLPLPVMFLSEREKDACRKNKNAQSRLEQMLSHISTQVPRNKFMTSTLKENDILMEFSSLAALEVVVSTISSRARDEHVINMKIFLLQCRLLCVHSPVHTTHVALSCFVRHVYLVLLITEFDCTAQLNPSYIILVSTPGVSSITTNTVTFVLKTWQNVVHHSDCAKFSTERDFLFVTDKGTVRTYEVFRHVNKT